MPHKSWGMLGKLAYKLFLRDLLKKAVASTDTQFDDKMLEMLDAFAGHKK